MPGLDVKDMGQQMGYRSQEWVVGLDQVVGWVVGVGRVVGLAAAAVKLRGGGEGGGQGKDEGGGSREAASCAAAKATVHTHSTTAKARGIVVATATTESTSLPQMLPLPLPVRRVVTLSLPGATWSLFHYQAVCGYLGEVPLSRAPTCTNTPAPPLQRAHPQSRHDAYTHTFVATKTLLGRTLGAL